MHNWKYILSAIGLLLVFPSFAAQPALTQQQLEALRKDGCARLFEERRYDQLLRATQEAIIAYPQFVQSCEQLLQWRVKAFLAKGDPQRAQVEAKRCYNLASIGFVDDAVGLMAEALSAYRVEDGRVWKLEQLRRASEAGEGGGGASLIDRIAVPEDVFLEASEKLKGHEWYGALFQRANLLLMADRPWEAWECMVAAYELAPEEYVTQASEGIARAMKAVDRGIGRGNAWIAEVAP